MKQRIRQQVRGLKKLQDARRLASWSEDICQALLKHPRIIEARSVMLYWPLSDEVDVRDAVKAFYRQGKTVVLPRVISDTEMMLCEYRGDGSLCEGRYGILEPQRPLSSDVQVEVIVVPGMAFTQDGWRLGRGKGYYDRLLAVKNDAYTIGVCYPFQVFENLPHDSHDIRVSEVLLQPFLNTDTIIYC